jgi:hypothetical protein
MQLGFVGNSVVVRDDSRVVKWRVGVIQREEISGELA